MSMWHLCADILFAYLLFINSCHTIGEQSCFKQRITNVTPSGGCHTRITSVHAIVQFILHLSHPFVGFTASIIETYLSVSRYIAYRRRDRR